MPKQLTMRDLAELMRSMPGASEDEVLAKALEMEGIPAPSIPGVAPNGPGAIPDPRSLEPQEEPGMLRRAADMALGRLYEPTLRTQTARPQQDAYSMSKVGALPMPEQIETLNIRDYPKALASELSSPADIVGLAAGLGGAAAGARGMLGISRAARHIEAASNVPLIVAGADTALRAENPIQGVVGAGMAGLGAYGAKNAMTHAFPVGKVRETYLKEAGRSTARPALPDQWDPDLAARTADAFEAMKHAPNDPQVRASYEALAEEVDRQYRFVTERAGLRTSPSSVPYAGSADMRADVVGHNRMRYFPTDEGFGDGAITDNPLLQTDAKGIPINDKLRVVHDYFGHADQGHQFGPLGERRAYLEHRSMMPDEAVGALTTETHGQNSWVNAGKHIRRADGSIPKAGDPDFIHPSQRPYADQKSGILPPHIIDPPEYRFMDAAELTGPNTPLADGTPYGAVSAANPGMKLTDAENVARTAALKKELREEGFYRPLDQTGMFDYPEPSVLVPGLPPEEAQRLGKKYGQISSISAEGYHRHADNATFKQTGPPVFDPEATNYYSELHDVRYPDGRRVKYQMQFPDEAYGPPTGTAAETAAPESGAASPGPSGRTSVEDTIQRQTDAPAGSLADNDGPTIELLDADGPNASGESAASLEAQSRLASMQARGEQFVLIGPDRKTIRPIANTVDAIDVQAPKGWQKGVRGPDGNIRLLSVAAPAAVMGMPSTGDEETDAILRALVLGGSTAVLLKSPELRKLVTALPEHLNIARFIRKLPDGYTLTDEGIGNLRRWYQASEQFPEARGVWARQNELLSTAFDGNDDLQRTFNRLQAATSPQAELAQSTREALGAHAASLRYPGQPITKELIEAEGVPMQNAGSKVPNVNLALQGKPMQSGKYIGKVQEYGDLINGDPFATPPDTHHMGMLAEAKGDFNAHLPELRNFFAFMEGAPAPGQRGALSPQDIYDRFKEARTRGWLAAVPDVVPSEAFADAWGARRHALGIPDATKTPADLMMERGLGERGALLDPDAIRAALMGQSWPRTGSAGLASARTRRKAR